ncbi:MAG: hypothetical protein P4L39_07800 [Humidesulfovibrio sp.]|nr:hypothetical protein [Humidesulfovibrio sp.]
MEVGWRLRFSRESALEFLVQSRLAPNVEDAVFIAGGWSLSWDGSTEADGWLVAKTRRKAKGE